MWKFVLGVATGIGGLEFFSKTELGKSWIDACKNTCRTGLRKINEVLNPSTKKE